AQAMRSGSRVEDVLARLGGDEFALTLSNTGVDGAVAVAERVRRGFAELRGCEEIPLSLPGSRVIGLHGRHTSRSGRTARRGPYSQSG
ncbi:MAG: diguanylate cyclase, partial [Actinobacteria bacterium]|nr:diguanylate cyclase [Actinomycetota bacterium]